MFLASPAFAGRFFTTVPPDPLIPFFHEIFCEHSCPLIFSTSESLPSTLKHTHPLLIVISKVAPVNRLLRKVERTADHNIRKTLKWKQHPYSSFFLDTPQFCLEAATAQPLRISHDWPYQQYQSCSSLVQPPCYQTWTQDTILVQEINVKMD